MATKASMPARVRVGGDEDVARFEIGLGRVQDDARPSLRRFRPKQAARSQRAGREIVAPVRPGDRNWWPRALDSVRVLI